MLPPPPVRPSPPLTRLLLAVLAVLPCLYGRPGQAQVVPDPSVIDVAVFYTPAIKNEYGGTEGIKARIDMLVAETNMAYAASGVNQTINLVAVEEVTGYTEGTTTHEDLARLINKSDGHMDEVHAIRDRVWADIVMLLPRTIGGVTVPMLTESTAYAPYAFGVSGVHTYNFAHELGHIMGLLHDRFVSCSSSSCGGAVARDAYGYVNQEAFKDGAAASARWRTIMAYDRQCGDSGFGCPRLLRFSNPNQRYPDTNGHPMGVALTAGNADSTAVDGPANAVRVLNETRDTVANFRPGVTVRFDAAAYTATEDGPAATVTVQLDIAPGRVLVMPLTASSPDGAWPHDYSLPADVTFSATQTTQSFPLTAVGDAIDENDETLTLAFGALPPEVSVGSQASTVVTLADNDTTAGAPRVTTVTWSSAPEPGGTYGVGAAVAVAVRFDKHVRETGTPQLGLTIGTTTRQATYHATRSAGEVLIFTYPVAAGEHDPDGVSIAANSLTLNGGTIQDSAHQAATLTHAAVAADRAHAVDGVKPVLQTVSVDGATVTLTYDETLDGSAPPPSAFTVTGGGTAVAVTAVRVAGRTVTLTLAAHVVHAQAVMLRYTPPAEHPLQDVSHNPAAALSGQAVTNTTPTPVYDTDADGLIAVTTLAQLDALRHDLDGDGRPTASGAAAYRRAFEDFPAADAQLACGHRRGCGGYELGADLDFDTNGNGSADAGDTYWNAGAGWQPIGTYSTPFRTTFEGNGHTIRNLFIARRTNHIGLFGRVSSSGVLRTVGVVAVDVTGGDWAGGLVGWSNGPITASYATGWVTGSSRVGGLVGLSQGSITTSYATGRVTGRYYVGGLVGLSQGSLTTSYATGWVTGNHEVGGLVGLNWRASISTSYATGRVTGSLRHIGGLVGENSNGTVTASYWDTDTSGQTSSAGGTGQTTAQLQVLKDTSGLYADWNANHWDFGTASQYPALKVDFDGDGRASWPEFGYQVREGPALTATPGQDQVALRWTAVNTNHWTPAPAVTYTVTREEGSTVETLAEGVSNSAFTDRTGDPEHIYQVAAVVAGGEATRSGLVPVGQTVTLAAKDGATVVTEGTAVAFTLTRRGAATNALPVNVQVTQTGTVIKTAGSYQAPTTVAFTAGATTATLTVETQADAVDEASGTITAAVTAGTGYTLGTTTSATVTITDDDEPVVAVSFKAATYRVNEGAAVEVTVRLSADPERQVEIPLTRTPGSNVEQSDYSGVPDAIIFESGDRERSFSFIALADQEDEAAETVTLDVDVPSLPPGVEAGSPTTAVVTIAALTPPPPPPPPPPPLGRGGGGGPACAEDVHGNTAAQATDIALSVVTAGAICPAADVDYFTVTAPGRGLVFVDTTGGVNLRGTILQNDVVLAAGPTDRQQNDRLGARVQAGPVVVAVHGQGGATGPYAVEITFVPGYLENPGADSFQSGVGVLSGWVCEAAGVEIEIGDTGRQVAAYGTERVDTARVCGDTDNGFGLLFNWNLLGDGDHTVVALVDGVELGRATVTVTTLGQEFLRGAEGECVVEDFPRLGQTVLLEWQQTSQNFVLAGGSAPTRATTGRPSGLTGYLENPGLHSFQSGVGVLSGWVCDADMVEIAIGHLGRQEAGYGTERLDTWEVCGDTDNGFGLLFNWNLLGDGAHDVVAYVDAVELGRATVRVTTLGVEFLRGVEGECPVEDFPAMGQTVLLEWQQNSQNFVITDVE